MSIQQIMMATYANPMIVVDSADFDGTNDFMTRGAGLTGAVDSRLLIISLWFRLDGGDGTLMTILQGFTGGNLHVWVKRLATNKLEIMLRDASLLKELQIETVNSYLAGSTWHHLLFGINNDAGGAVFSLYMDDAADEGSSSTQGAAEPIDFTLGEWAIGRNTSAGAETLNACLAELYFAPGQYLDFSNVYFRRKFISASGKPVHLGTTGALPTGTAPLVYHHIDDGEAVANFATNRGTGGDFTITGTLTTGSTSPSD